MFTEAKREGLANVLPPTTMLELTTLTVFIGYLVYLRYYADQRTKAEKEADDMREGIDLYESRRYVESLTYFNRLIEARSQSGVAFLYRARCYRALGDPEAALADLERGKSYDDTVADLHLETGQIRTEQHNYPAAFLDFDKAIFYSHGAAAEPYRWRGLARQQLQQTAEAKQDLARAEAIDQTPKPVKTDGQPGKKMFVDRLLVRNALLTVLVSLLLLFVIKHSPVIHWPYLVAAASAAGIGFLEPRRGWSLAIVQVITLWGGYQLLVTTESSTQREVEAFSLYGSMGLTFIGSFVGSILQRAMA